MKASNPQNHLTIKMKQCPLEFRKSDKKNLRNSTEENSQDSAFRCPSKSKCLEEKADKYLHRDESLEPRRQICWTCYFVGFVTIW